MKKSYLTLTTYLFIFFTFGSTLSMQTGQNKYPFDFSLIEDRFDILFRDNGIICSDFYTLYKVALNGRQKRLNPTIIIQSLINPDLDSLATWQLSEERKNDEKEMENLPDTHILTIDLRSHEHRVINSEVMKLFEDENKKLIIESSLTFMQRNCYLVSFSTLCIGIAWCSYLAKINALCL